MKRITIAGAALATGLFATSAFAEEPVVAEPTKPDAPKVEPSKILDAVKVEPFVTLVGGLKGDTIIQASDQAQAPEQRRGRVSAIALGAFGLRGTVGSLVSFHSELMFNGGTSLHGSSAWEGQAALQVRRQVVRLATGPWMIEAGRVIDEASVNFVSAHVLDTLLQDTATRDPLLYSGFNMGNGVRGTYEALPGLRLGLTFTAGNPVATTSSLQVGGSFPPFERFYIQPYQAVKQSLNNYPDDTFHMMLLSPSILFSNPYVDAKAAFQGYVVDTNTNRKDDENIRGYNVRGDLRVKLYDEALVPFANASLERNDTVLPTDVSKLSPDKYTSLTFGGGVDVNYRRPWAGRSNGIGAQYDRIQYQVGNGNITNLHYINVGTTYWLNANTALGLRAAVWLRNDVGVHDEGERSLLLTLRIVL